MSLVICNSLSKKQEAFVALNPGHVSMYVCGPTVYDHAHIGHARSEVFFDVVARYLRFSGYRVNHVRNFTDIDDKIIERSRLLNTSTAEIALRYIESYHTDMDSLGIIPPDFEPRVTGHINAILSLIDRLIQNGHAYVRNGNVLYRVGSLGDYGLPDHAPHIDGMPSSSIAAHETVKEDARDFVLWKRVHDNGPVWESPWGSGRPGWHIECVAMSQSILGTVFDIHGGGQDLMFPHHENERAISRASSGTSLARYWLHHALVTADNKKLSRSKGSPYLIRDLCRMYHREAIRLFILSTHYHRPLDFTLDRLSQASSALDRLYGLLQRLRDDIDLSIGRASLENPLIERACKAMDNDLNIPEGINIIFAAARRLNRALDGSRHKGNLRPDDLEELGGLVRVCRDVLGILTDTPEVYFKKRGSRTGLAPQHMKSNLLEVAP